MDDEQVRQIATTLEEYATHFATGDWEYTRDLGGLKAIKYSYESDKIRARLARACRTLFERKSIFAGDRSRWSGALQRVQLAYYLLLPEKHLPDGQLNEGTIITHWEEDGELIQLMQPSVAVILAQFMKADPSNPWARLIAGEMRRIQDAYSARLGYTIR